MSARVGGLRLTEACAGAAAARGAGGVCCAQGDQQVGPARACRRHMDMNLPAPRRSSSHSAIPVTAFIVFEREAGAEEGRGPSAGPGPRGRGPCRAVLRPVPLEVVHLVEAIDPIGVAAALLQAEPVPVERHDRARCRWSRRRRSDVTMRP